jgi:hypothetical protein
VLLTQPHLPVVDHRGESTRFVALGGPLDTRHAEQVHAALRADDRPMVGFTSYKRFPLATAEMAERYLAECAGWCHCFRDAAPFAALPTIELSHSDLVDVCYVDPRTFGSRTASWDYAYVCLPGREVEKAKEWALARECIRRLSLAGLSGILVGRSPIRDLPPASRVAVRPRLRWAPFLRTLAAARCLLIASVTDASPRIIAEALALDRPVVVNGNIVGGWKYVNDATGAFFSSERDIVDVVSQVLERATAPREWYCEFFGLCRSGARLKDFLNGLGGRLRAPYVTLGHVPAID